ncbi:MAG: response regulator [Candidatus Rokubacteria bacterium]|nr:response regulator [Candidatus Rokubacteria bacterium]
MGRIKLSEDRGDRWVLVADADPEAAIHLAGYFARRGFRTYHTTRGEEAMLLAYSRRLLLVVVDVSLLDMSGHTLARRLKEIDPELPVLMTSGDYAPEQEAAARRVGILYYAHKPADYRLIGGVVDKALRN